MALKQENVPDRAHSELTFKKIFGDYEPMHTVATAEQLAQYRQATPRDFYCFGIPREYPVVRFDVPAAVMLTGETGRLEHLELTAQPGEFLPFQIAVWTPDQALQRLRVTCGDFPLPVRVFLQETARTVNLTAGRLQVFWCMVELPAEPGDFAGTITVSAEGFDDVALPARIVSAGEFLPDGGVSDDARLARLRWLDSDIGVSHDIPQCFQPLRRDGRTLTMLGRTLTLGEDGLPASAESMFTGINDALGDEPQPIIASPFRFMLSRNGGRCRSRRRATLEFTAEDADRICWTGRSALAAGVELTVSGYLDYDGFCGFDCQMHFTSGGHWSGCALSFTATGEQFIGLDRPGDKAPGHLRWCWDPSRNQDDFWLGALNAGMRLRLRDRSSRTPLTNCYFQFSKKDIPPAWDNHGQGGIDIRKRQDGIFDIQAFTGPIDVTTGQTLDFGFELQLTPFKLTQFEKHLKQRFFQPYMHDLPMPLAELFSDDFFQKLRDDGVQIINIHHALKENPAINMPFTGCSLAALQEFVAKAHGQGFKVGLYYTTRELSLHTPEFWPFASLRGEIVFPGPGKEARPVTAPMGPHPYLQTNCASFPFLSAWAEPIKEGPLKGILDLAVETSTDGRLDNFYLEGLKYLLERCPIDGLYLDDTALSREGFKRLWTVFRNARGCDPIINLHSWNPYNGQNDYGHQGPVLRDMAFYPFVTSLWLGEAFFYERVNHDYYLTEISGLPYGLMSEMLRNGGNPWRGLLFGMTGRHGWLADPRPIWKVMDDMDVPHCRMVGFYNRHPMVATSSSDVKATLFTHPDGRRMVALASWCQTAVAVTIAVEGRPFSTMRLVEIDGLQTADELPAGAPLRIEPLKGAVVMLE